MAVIPTTAQSRQLVAQTIRYRRLSAGLTQDGVARKLGVTLTAVSRWELGKALPSKQHVRNLARTLGGEPLDYIAF